jgi:hypothetical protein
MNGTERVPSSRTFGDSYSGGASVQIRAGTLSVVRILVVFSGLISKVREWYLNCTTIISLHTVNFDVSARSG